MQYLFRRSKEDLALAKAECVALHPKATCWEERGPLLLCTAPRIAAERLAFTREAYEIIVRGPPAQAEEWLRKHPSPTGKRVRCFKESVDGTATPGEEAYGMLLTWLGRPAVDLMTPEETYGIISVIDEWFVVKLLWENMEDFASRKSHRTPAPHPTGMHPKLARAMINLSQAKREVLDPFCGAGGILLEAKLMGYESTGIDIDPLMIARCRNNLKHFDVQATLIKGDALAYEEKTEVIVTDAPYGRNSKAKELDVLFSDFLKHAATLTRKMVIGLPQITDNEALIEGSSWRKEQRFDWRLHRSLKKEIYVLSTEELLEDPPREPDGVVRRAVASADPLVP